jgi:hypothetical protein
MAGERQGPFDRILRTTSDGEPAAPDRAFVYVGGTILGLALLLLILILPPISVLSRGDDGDGGAPAGPRVSEDIIYEPRGGMPKTPAGLSAASIMLDLTAAPENPPPASAITVNLKEKQSDARALGLYTHVDGRWQRLSDVSLLEGGLAARGEVQALPANVAILRRSRASLQVAGAVPAGSDVADTAKSLLTVSHPLVFIPTGEGGVIGQAPAVPPGTYNVVPVIVPLDPAVVDDIMRSGDLRARHAEAIAQAVESGNFAGINVDYRNLNTTLGEQYSEFVEALSAALEANGRTLTLTLPLPQRVEGELDAGPFDWARLGDAADTIEIAGEVDQELYFQNTEAGLDYVTERVDRSKLLLTISSLSVERGNDGLRTMSLTDALTLASIVGVKTEGDIAPGAQVQLVAQNISPDEGASGLGWDETARAVTFSYPGRGGKRTVWLSNRFSAAFRLELAQRYGLGGVVIADASQQGGSDDVWAPVRELADSGSITLTRPHGDFFTPVWSAPQGTLTATSGGNVTWTAPQEPGTYEITLIVSDGVIRLGQRITLEVVAPPPPEDE